MQQIFAHYEKWEDYKAGMFSTNDIKDKDKKINDAINLLSSEIDFYDALKKMCDCWKVATDVNLTNKQQNRRAWLGAAACMFIHNTPEYLTRIAWCLLDKQTKNRANLIAEKIIKEYENDKSNIKTLFG